MEVHGSGALNFCASKNTYVIPWTLVDSGVIACKKNRDGCYRVLPNLGHFKNDERMGTRIGDVIHILRASKDIHIYVLHSVTVTVIITAIIRLIALRTSTTYVFAPWDCDWRTDKWTYYVVNKVQWSVRTKQNSFPSSNELVNVSWAKLESN